SVVICALESVASLAVLVVALAPAVGIDNTAATIAPIKAMRRRMLTSIVCYGFEHFRGAGGQSRSSGPANQGDSPPAWYVAGTARASGTVGQLCIPDRERKAHADSGRPRAARRQAAVLAHLLAQRRDRRGDGGARAEAAVRPALPGER